MENLPRRLRRLKEIWVREQPVSFFLTICVEGRQQVLNNELLFSRVVAFLLDSPPRYAWWPRCCLLMPDHLHMIASQGRSSVSLGQWIKAFKAVVAKREFAWQQGFFDHLIRSQESEREKWEYIGLNPVRKGLVSRPEEWLYGGQFVSTNSGLSFVPGFGLGRVPSRGAN
jgi:REP element-mobilizing transposase RayT